jgi:hypothetical protein
VTSLRADLPVTLHRAWYLDRIRDAPPTLMEILKVNDGLESLYHYWSKYYGECARSGASANLSQLRAVSGGTTSSSTSVSRAPRNAC